MNWKEATRAQLYEIAYNDRGAPLKYKLAAVEEIERRQKKIVVDHKRKKIRLG